MKSAKAILLRFCISFLPFSIFLISCSKNETNFPKISNPNISSAIANEAKKFDYRNVFGAALSKAIEKNSSLRTIIKTLANTNFDGISEVLYCDILAKVIDGISVNNYIKQFADDKNLFQTAVEQSPLLTIYVPTLPSNWNATNWDTDNEIPGVAVEQNYLDNQKSINIYDATGKISALNDTLIPGLPTLVIKENSRVCLKSYNDLMIKTYSKGSDFPVFYESINGQELYFLSDKLNQTKNALSTNTNKTLDFLYPNPSLNSSLSPEVLTAYNLFGTSWPRDYIYYGLTPTITTGTLNNRSAENLRYFWFTSNAVQSQISTETYDPQIIKIKGSLTDASWTSGSYHITFTILINAKNGIGQTLQKSIFLTPDQVWTVTYHKVLFTYNYSSITPISAPINIAILPFDLNNYSVAWKISVEDTRPTQAITNTETYSSQFAENISFDPTVGLFKKYGVKFGASATQTETQTHTVTTTLGSIKLGDIILNFYDPVITSEMGPISSPTSATTLDYSTGSVGLSIVPTRQW